MIASILQTMRDYGITLEELQAAKAKPGTSQTRAKRPGAPKTVAPKYRHPESGETWSGRGKPPRWLAAAEAAGADRTSFLI